MIKPERTIQVPNLPTIPSHGPAGWADLIEEAITLLDREHPGWGLAQIKQKFGGLRIYYEPRSQDREHREAVQEMVNLIEARSYDVCDICGAEAAAVTGPVSRTRCAEHQRAPDVDLPIVAREVLELNDYMFGVWIVETRGSTHVWDLDNMDYTRRPGPSSRAGSMKFDGNPMPITRVEAWPKVGEPFFVWFDDPDDPDLLEHYRTSSAVRRILPVELIAPTRAREANGVDDG